MIPKIILKIKFETLQAVLLVIVLAACYIALCRRPKELNTIRSGKFHSPSVDKRNIFFIESSCMKDQADQQRHHPRGIKLNARQACAIESTARTNPQALIYLLHTCPLDEQHLGTSEEFVKELFSHPNVFGFHVDVYQFLKGTPMQGWYPNSGFQATKYPVEHGSDILRWVTLWKFGGIYLDLDFVVMHPLSDLRSNYAGFQSETIIACGALSFDAGHELTVKVIKEMKANFSQEYAGNGPTLFTRALTEYCNARTISDITPKNCNGVVVYPPVFFYPVGYEHSSDLFDANLKHAKRIADLVHISSYMVQMWNFRTKTLKIDKRRMVQAYGLLAQRYCPVSFGLSGPDF